MYYIICIFFAKITNKEGNNPNFANGQYQSIVIKNKLKKCRI